MILLRMQEYILRYFDHNSIESAPVPTEEKIADSIVNEESPEAHRLVLEWPTADAPLCGKCSPVQNESGVRPLYHEKEQPLNTHRIALRRAMTQQRQLTQSFGGSSPETGW